MQLSRANHTVSPPTVEIPRDYNAAQYRLASNARHPGKVAFFDALSGQRLTYGELTDQAHRFALSRMHRGQSPR